MRTHLRRGLAAAGLLAGWLAGDAVAQTSARVSAARDTLTVRTCADPSCAIVTELPRGRSVEVLKTENGWHQVLVTLDGSRATTGWVEAARTTPASRPGPSYSAPVAAGVRETLPPRPGSAPAPAPEPSECLTCVATRTPTSEEWNSALMATASVKAAPALPADMAAAPAPRAEVVRRDGRTSVERMRDAFDLRFGDELKRLNEIAVGIDPDLQNYMATCYDRYLAIPVLPPGPTPPGGTPPPVRPRATLFDLWRGRPPFAWNESWSTRAYISAESTTLCQRIWDEVSMRAADVKAGVERIEAAARAADIYPGVVRDALRAYGLSDNR